MTEESGPAGEPQTEWGPPDPEHPYDRATLRQILRVLPGGKSVGKVRDLDTLPLTKTVSPEDDPETTFTIRRADNRIDVSRANMFSRVRYIPQDESEGYITERDFPMGDMQIATIKLCLVSWNIEDKSGKLYPINEATIERLITPEERVWLYGEIIDFNPTWQNREQSRKNS